MFRSLRSWNFRLWLAGILVSNVGVWMQRTAQDWMVLTELTDHDAAAVGLATALQFAPQLVLVPLTGLVADRVDRRRLLLITQGSMALVGAGLAIVTLLGAAQFWNVCVFALALGVATAFDIPARQAFVGQLVADEALPNAVALNSAAFNGARLLGPAIGGLLVAVAGAGWVFALSALLFAGIISAILLLRAGEIRPVERASGRGQIAAGLRYVRGRPDLILIMAVMGVFGMVGVQTPLYVSTMARIRFDGDAALFGVLSSAIAAGSIVGALIAARTAQARLVVAVAALAGFGLIAGSAALAPTLAAFAVLLVVLGFMSMMLMSTANAYVLASTAPAFRGRVLSLYIAVFIGTSPIGAPLVGALINALGPPAGLATSGVVCLATAGVAGALLARRSGAALRWDRGSRFPRVRLSWRRTDREALAEELAITEAEARR